MIPPRWVTIGRFRHKEVSGRPPMRSNLNGSLGLSETPLVLRLDASLADESLLGFSSGLERRKRDGDSSPGLLGSCGDLGWCVLAEPLFEECLATGQELP